MSNENHSTVAVYWVTRGLTYFTSKMFSLSVSFVWCDSKRCLICYVIKFRENPWLKLQRKLGSKAKQHFYSHLFDRLNNPRHYTHMHYTKSHRLKWYSNQKARRRLYKMFDIITGSCQLQQTTMAACREDAMLVCLLTARPWMFNFISFKSNRLPLSEVLSICSESMSRLYVSCGCGDGNVAVVAGM